MDNKHLTHWGRVMHICVSKLTIIGSDEGLSLARRQAIIWTSDGILLIKLLGTNFSEILIEIHTISCKKIRLKRKMAAILSWSQCFNALCQADSAVILHVYIVTIIDRSLAIIAWTFCFIWITEMMRNQIFFGCCKWLAPHLTAVTRLQPGQVIPGTGWPLRTHPVELKKYTEDIDKNNITDLQKLFIDVTSTLKKYKNWGIPYDTASTSAALYELPQFLVMTAVLIRKKMRSCYDVKFAVTGGTVSDNNVAFMTIL